MNQKLIFLILLIFISGKSLSQYSLEIEITGLRNDKGCIMLQLFNENQTVIGEEKGVIKDNKSIIVFNDLKPGKYAVRYFHDENLDGKLETNGIGKPLEGYGFSNNAYG
ncbi:MAG: DUF2141 domain-containing protein, partial [Bacteroidales bacterium]